MSFEGQQVTLLAEQDFYCWIQMRGAMVSPSHRPLTVGEVLELGMGGEQGVDADWKDNETVTVWICVGKVGKGRRENRWKTERQWGGWIEKGIPEKTIGAVLPCCMHQMVFIDYSLHAMDVTVTAHGSAPFCSLPQCTWGQRWGRGELYRAALDSMWMLRG